MHRTYNYVFSSPDIFPPTGRKAILSSSLQKGGKPTEHPPGKKVFLLFLPLSKNLKYSTHTHMHIHTTQEGARKVVNLITTRKKGSDEGENKL